MSLNAKQKEAVEYIQGPLLVLAGPGTGKTFLLSNRVEYILRNTDANPENILCLTFTDNGASNMRTRLLSTVGKAARRLEIHTYHAFGADLISEYRSYAQEPGRVLDSPIDEVMQFKIVKDIQESLDANDILRTGATKDIVSTIQSAKSARLTGDDLLKIAEDNTRVCAEMSDMISTILEESLVPRMKFHDAVALVYNPILQIFADYQSEKCIVKDIEPIANAYYSELSKVILDESVKEKPSVSPLTKWKDATFEKDENGKYRLKCRVANLKLKSLGNIMNLYDKRLEDEGLFDFADMIEQAILMLKNDKGFRLTMSEKYQYILLDEFQDTNPSQFELIKLLTDYEEPNVMAVGDDDQAIFEFQGADASNLLTFQQHYGAKVINLEENYRSNQEILNLSRKIADQIDGSFIKNPNIQKKATISKALKAIKGEGAVISRHEFLASDSEYDFVANEIRKLIDEGVKQSDIAIIAPKHKYIAPLLPFLKSDDKIKISYEKRDNLLEDPRLSEILTLARFVYDLSQGKNVSSRLLEILSFPFFKIPAVEAIRNVRQAKEDKKAGLDYLLKSDSPKLREIGEWLAKLAMLSFDSPLELMMDYFVGTVAVDLTEDTKYRSPFIEYYDAEQGEYETFELYENLAVLKSTILARSKASNLRLKDLISLLEDYEQANATLSNSSPYRDSDDAIQIVTAHKSKGLEYEYVFLVGTDNLSWGKAKGNNNMLVLPKNLIQIRHTGATEDERLRLFFVALTRAKSHLIITNSLKDFSGKSPARLDYLEEHEEEDEETHEKCIVSPFIGKVELHYEDLSEIRKVVDLRKSWRAAYTKLTPELRPILLDRMKDYSLSATDVTNFVNIAYGGPLDFYHKKVLKSPQEPKTESQAYGDYMHEVFEKITNATVKDEEFTDEQAVAFYRDAVQKADLPDKDTKYLLEKGEVSLRIALEAFRDIFRDKNARAEVNLYPEHPEVGGAPAGGYVDHMRIDDDAKEIEIYDFKTGNYKEGKWGSDRGLFMYMLQLGMYKLMVESSIKWKNYKVKKGHILFVTPDDDGKVHDKVLDFENDKDYDDEQLKAIASAVYKQATTLAFLDDEQLMVEPDKNAGMTKIREFIKLLLDKTE